MKTWIKENEKSVNIAYIDEESHQHKPTFSFSHFNLGLSIDYNI